MIMITEKHVPKLNITARFIHRDLMKNPHPLKKFKFKEDVTLPTTTLPVDGTGDGTVLCPMNGNDSLGDCHDSNTEVLTEKGWKYWSEYDGQSLLATMNQRSGMLEFQAPL